MGTGTLTSRSTGETITSSFFNDFNSALQETFVGRNSSGAATSGQSLGTAAIPWGSGYFNSLIIDGSALDTTQITSPANRIVSGATRSSSNQPQFITPNGSALSLVINGGTTNLVYDVNGAAVTCSTNITVASLTAAPSSNNTCLLNDTDAADGNNTRTWGEIATVYNPRYNFNVNESALAHKEVLTVDNMGSEITALVGKWAAFNVNDGSNDEQFIGFVKSSTEITNCSRGFFTNSSGAPVNRIKIANNDTITLLKLTWVFITNDGTTADVTYTNPVWSFDQPGSPSTGDYWYDLSVSQWKRYSGSAFVSINRTLIGVVASNTSNCIAARSFDFWKNPKSTNTFTLRAKSATNVITDNSNASINIYGTDFYFKYYLPEWNITTDLAASADMYTATEQASTYYYFYLKDTGDRVISDIEPIQRPDLYGAYHPHNPWRCIGVQYNDSSSNLTGHVYPLTFGLTKKMLPMQLADAKTPIFFQQVDYSPNTSASGSGVSWITMTQLTVAGEKINNLSEIWVWSNGCYMSTEATYNFAVTRMVRVDPGSDSYYNETLNSGGSGADVDGEKYHSYNMIYRDDALVYGGGDHVYEGQVSKPQSNALNTIVFHYGGANTYCIGFSKTD